jgi:anti-anti-sigma factor
VTQPEEIGRHLRGGIAHVDGTLVYVLEGHIDMATADAMLERLIGVASSCDGDLVLDMSGVRFMDSNGVRVLLRLRDELSGLGHGLQVKNPSSTVRRVLEVLEVGSLFGVAPPD